MKPETKQGSSRAKA